MQMTVIITATLTQPLMICSYSGGSKWK